MPKWRRTFAAGCRERKVWLLLVLDAKDVACAWRDCGLEDG
jgi:hypothetical protein